MVKVELRLVRFGSSLTQLALSSSMPHDSKCRLSVSTQVLTSQVRESKMILKQTYFPASQEVQNAFKDSMIHE
jgi:hypothetical protein